MFMAIDLSERLLHYGLGEIVVGDICNSTRTKIIITFTIFTTSAICTSYTIFYNCI